MATVYYCCPQCGAPRSNGGRASKKTGEIILVYEYRCGTELRLKRLDFRYIPKWEFKCEFKSGTIH